MVVVVMIIFCLFTFAQARREFIKKLNIFLSISLNAELFSHTEAWQSERSSQYGQGSMLFSSSTLSLTLCPQLPPLSHLLMNSAEM